MNSLTTTSPDEQADRKVVRRWLMLSVGALITAGLFSLGLVIGRMPPFSDWVTDPGFFKRALVVHVDLALIVWFYAFIVGLFHLIPMSLRARKIAGHAAAVSAVGVVMMVLSAGVKHAEPVLANYVPVVDHPVFLLGLGLFAVGVLVAVSSGGLWSDSEAREGIVELPGAAVVGLRATAVLMIVAAMTFFTAWLATPTTLGPDAYYELLFWGGGHVLQVACEAAMVAVWIVLLSSLLDRPLLAKKTAVILFGLLVAPHLAAPFLAIGGTQTALYHAGSTFLMRWGIFPAVLVFMGISIRALYRAFKAGQFGRKVLADPRFVGFATSAGLALCGFIIGAMIRGSNTMIPAHYHAAIGAVTVAFMTVALLLLEPIGLELPSGRWKRAARWQPVLFGTGQLVFAVGFAFAGAHGMARKAYGAEQQIRGIADWLGLATMGVGGLIAIAGGLLFLGLIAAAARPRMTAMITSFKSPKPRLAD
ncbi:MAG: cbb3-type cytochrome c oxidase subunit I [Persicimonas sp.]